MEHPGVLKDIRTSLWLPIAENHKTNDNGDIIGFLTYEDAKAAFAQVGLCRLISFKGKLPQYYIETCINHFATSRKCQITKIEYKVVASPLLRDSCGSAAEVIYHRVLIKQ